MMSNTLKIEWTKRVELSAALIQASAMSACEPLMEKSELLSELGSSFGEKGGQSFIDRWDVCFCVILAPHVYAHYQDKYKLSSQETEKFFKDVSLKIEKRIPEFCMAQANLTDYLKQHSKQEHSVFDYTFLQSKWLLWNLMEKEVENDEERKLAHLIGDFVANFALSLKNEHRDEEVLEEEVLEEEEPFVTLENTKYYDKK